MSRWELIDCLNALEEDQENPKTPIESESQLREELKRLGQRRPGLVLLAGPDQGMLAINIGGPFAGLGWIAPPSQRQLVGDKVALPARVSSPEEVEFLAEGVPTPIRVEELFPVEEVIEAAASFYRTHHLPDWIGWRSWDPVTKSWDVKPATTALSSSGVQLRAGAEFDISASEPAKER
jgi:hypothetical protein